MLETLKAVMSNSQLWGAILSTILIVALGFTLVKIKVFKAEWKGVLNAIVLKVALPALAISGFMKTATIKELQEQGVVLGISVAFYAILCLIAFVWVNYSNKKVSSKITDNSIVQTIGGENVSQGKALVIWMMLIFGSTTFFGLPIIKSVYNSGVAAANIWSIPYRVFLYSYCFMLMAGLKFDRANITKSLKTALLNPIVIATFVGLICYLSGLIPAKIFQGANEKGKIVAWFDLSVTAPWLHKPFTYLSGLASPLVWLSIGMTLATSNLASAAKNKWVWIFAVLKLVALPAMVFGVFWALNAGALVTKAVAASMVIFAAVPPATVVIAYAMQYKNNEQFAAECSALTTLLAIVAIPFWIFICEVAFR